jgi:glycosyltransferase involved in cell wall biosynthesis
MSEKNKNILPDLSVVVLCYRSGILAYDFVEELTKLMSENVPNNFELVLVGNYHKGSDDPTPKIVQEISRRSNNIIAVTLPKEGMMGWDMRSGLHAATGMHIAVIDGDKQMPIEDLTRVYELLKKGQYDLVKTYRITRGDGLWRKTVSFIYNLLFKILFPGLKSKDINSKPKIFTREAFNKLDLKNDDWFIDAEMMIQARRYHFNIGEVPTRFLGLGGRRASFVRFSAILQFLKNMLIYRLKETMYHRIKS